MQALTETTRPALDSEAGATRRTLAALPDRAQREASAALARTAFCDRLKDTREGKGIALATIAARTKVSQSLFAALERGDVSRWPTGIYRRSFFRAYANAIGVSVETALDEFLDLFPDEYEPPQPVAAPGAGAIRLALAAAPPYRLSKAYLSAAFLDLTTLLLVASAVAWWTAWSPATLLASTTLLYYVVSTAVLGSSPGAWWLRWRAERKRFKGLRLAR
jgi:transcriptional regulator with XRE-family HTH domain